MGVRSTAIDIPGSTAPDIPGSTALIAANPNAPQDIKSALIPLLQANLEKAQISANGVKGECPQDASGID